MLQWACDIPTLREWLSADRDEATMGTPAVQAVFEVLYALRDEVLRVTGIRTWRHNEKVMMIFTSRSAGFPEMFLLFFSCAQRSSIALSKSGRTKKELLILASNAHVRAAFVGTMIHEYWCSCSVSHECNNYLF